MIKLGSLLVLLFLFSIENISAQTSVKKRGSLQDALLQATKSDSSIKRSTRVNISGVIQVHYLNEFNANVSEYLK